MIFVALLAIILPLLCIVVFRMPAKIGMSISAVAVGIAALVAWQMTPLAVGASVAQAIHRALTIALILFGAITLLRTLQETAALNRIKLGFHAISADMRVQTVLVAFAFVSLLEGISGFGTPAIIAAPLLMVLGFRPIAAAVLALLGDTVAVTFGAVGTPLIVGLENVPNYSTNLTWAVGAQVATFDLVIGTLLPLMLVSVLVLQFSELTLKAKIRSILQITPWSLLIGATYAVSAFVVVRLIGPEFTAIIAGSVALLIGMVTAYYNVGLPRQIWRHHARPEDEAEEEVLESSAQMMPLWKAWLPYATVIVLLLLTRTVPLIRDVTSHVLDASWRGIFGFSEINSSWAVLYSPGTILLAAAVVAALVGSRSLTPLKTGAKGAITTVVGALLALVPTLIMVQIFTNSGINTSELAAMPVYIGETLATVFGGLWVAAAPLLGAIGAFIAGSATVSTLTMGPVQASIAEMTHLPLILVLALQMVGAAAGNIIAIHNVVAASTVVGLAHREGLIMRRLIMATMGYVGMAVVIGLACAALL
jgi:lactate permease